MRAAALAITLSASALAMAVIARAPANVDTRPARADCIAGAELLWADEEGDRVGILNQLSDLFGLTKEYPVAGQSIRERERIYIIFARNCAMKDQMMDQILTIYRENIPGFPPYRIIEERVEPSTKTIEVYGDEWSDGDMPPGLMD